MILMDLRCLVIFPCTDIFSDNCKFVLSNVPIVSLIPKVSLQTRVEDLSEIYYLLVW
jgi:hypothetical protein